MKELAWVWKIKPGIGKKKLALQKKKYRKNCVVFPIYLSGDSIFYDFIQFKYDSVGPDILLYHIRTKRTVYYGKHEVFRDFHLNNLDRFLFFKNSFGILAIFYFQNRLACLYTHRIFKNYDPIEINTDFIPEEEKEDVTKLTLFRRDSLLIVSGFKIYVGKMDMSKKRPSMSLIHIIRPYDIVKGLTVQKNNLMLIGYRTVEILCPEDEEDESKGLKTMSITWHNKLFEEEVYATILGQKIYLADEDRVYSFNFQEEGFFGKMMAWSPKMNGKLRRKRFD